MSSKHPGPVDLERDLPTTPEDVAALNEFGSANGTKPPA